MNHLHSHKLVKKRIVQLTITYVEDQEVYGLNSPISFVLKILEIDLYL